MGPNFFMGVGGTDQLIPSPDPHSGGATAHPRDLGMWEFAPPLSQHRQEVPKHLKHMFRVPSSLDLASGLLVTAFGANQLVTGQSPACFVKPLVVVPWRSFVGQMPCRHVLPTRTQSLWPDEMGRTTHQARLQEHCPFAPLLSTLPACTLL